MLAVLACILAVFALPKRTTGDPVEPADNTLFTGADEEDGTTQVVRHTPAQPGTVANPTEEIPAPRSESATQPMPPDRPTTHPLTPSPIIPPSGPTAKPLTPEKLVVKRRVEVGEAELLRQLKSAPELTLDHRGLVESKRMISTGILAARLGKDAGTTVALLEKRPDLIGMPWLKGDACKITPTAAGHLQDGSIALRSFMSGVATLAAIRVRGGAAPGLPNPDNLAKQMNSSAKYNHWQKDEAIPALQQLLMAEHEAIREVLVDQLARIEGKKGTEALAQRALYDLHPRVRERALKELLKRRVEDYRPILLKGFDHPWAPVAEHAAEALATLQLKETVPALLAMLDRSDPHAPRRDAKKNLVVKEMVRVNHLRNCLMCHAPSTRADDKVRGRVPPTNQPLPPAFSRAYYEDTSGVFVRADITYLRQEFSVPLPVKNHGVWPQVQRFDFVIRERPATPTDIKAASGRDPKKPSEHQRSLFFALRELTGADPGPTAEDWKLFFSKRKLKVRAVANTFKAARGLAVDRDGRVYVADSGVLYRKDGDGKPTVWLKDANNSTGLAINGKDNLLAAHTRTGQLVRIDAESREVEPLASRFDGRRFNHPNRLAIDRHGGVYFTDDRPLGALHEGGTYYLSAAGRVSRLPVALSRPRGVGLSPNGKMLYVSSPSSTDVMAYPIESAGSIGKGRVVCRLSGKTTNGPADLAVDSRGNLHLLNAVAQTVEVFVPEGAKVGQARLPDAPVACCFAQGSLHVLTRKALYTVETPDLDFTRLARR